MLVVKLERLRFHLRVYATARKILASGQPIDVVHHMLPFGLRATFNLLALDRRPGYPDRCTGFAEGLGDFVRGRILPTPPLIVSTARNSSEAVSSTVLPAAARVSTSCSRRESG